MEFADHRVPTGITGGNVFRKNELKRLSSGAAARLAGVPKPIFLQRLGSYGVATFRQTPEELLEELDNA